MCIHIYIYTRMCKAMHNMYAICLASHFVFICILIFNSTQMHIHSHIHMHVPIHMRTHVHMHICMVIFEYPYSYASSYPHSTYIHVCTYACIYLATDAFKPGMCLIWEYFSNESKHDHTNVAYNKIAHACV